MKIVDRSVKAFALLLVTILSLLWFFAVSRFLRADAWSDEPSHSR